MQTSFTDLVGTAVVPADWFDSAEMRDLVPALDTAAFVHDVAAQASEAVISSSTDYVCGTCSSSVSNCAIGD